MYEKPGIDHENLQISVQNRLRETQWKRADTFESREALRKHETIIFILHVSRRNRPAETQLNFEPSGFRYFSELRKHMLKLEGMVRNAY